MLTFPAFNNVDVNVDIGSVMPFPIPNVLCAAVEAASGKKL